MTASCVAVLLLLASTLWAQLGAPGRIRDFKLPEFYDPVPGQTPARRLKTLVTGAEAQPDLSGFVAVKGMRIESYLLDGRTNLVARAPQCTIDTTRRVAYSAGRVELVGNEGQFFLEGGQGFHCRLTNFALIISNRVRTVVRQAAFEPPRP